LASTTEGRDTQVAAAATEFHVVAAARALEVAPAAAQASHQSAAFDVGERATHRFFVYW